MGFSFGLTVGSRVVGCAIELIQRGEALGWRTSRYQSVIQCTVSKVREGQMSRPQRKDYAFKEDPTHGPYEYSRPRSSWAGQLP